MASPFTYAKPIFVRGKNLDMNIQTGYTCRFDGKAGKNYELLIAGQTLYRVTLNGKFVGYGPARAPHGYVRFDRFALPVKEGENLLAVELAGYNCPTFYTFNIPSFLQAEILEDGFPAAFTGRDFKGICLAGYREQKTLRYSYQRAFTEVYDLDTPLADWKNGDFAGDELETVAQPREYLPREYLVPEFNVIEPAAFVTGGKAVPHNAAVRPKNRFLQPGGQVKCFEPSELACDVIGGVDVEYIPDDTVKTELKAGEYARFRFPHIVTGFIRTKLTVTEPAVVYVVFSERVRGNAIDHGIGQLSFLNIIRYRLPVGTFTLESFECYSFLHVGVVTESGAVKVEQIDLREYVYPVKPIRIDTDDADLQLIMDAAYQSFRQNTLDCYMDCPGRERGGWLCDSFFTGKTSYLFTGSTETERTFLDAFRISKSFKGLPEGLLPMCYPGEIDSNTIPQWTMWYVAELYEFGERGGDTKPFTELLEKFLAFCEKYENADGLLESLPLWNFVEWSKANSWTKDVNYPTNMLYVHDLRVCAKMLDRPELAEKAERIRKVIIAQSFDGKYFADHAVRVDGKLVLCGDHSSICQHEAVYFDIIDINDPAYPLVKDAILNRCGFDVTAEKCPAELEPLDAFIGYAVRVELLLKLGLYEQDLREIKALYGMMAKATGTFWEHQHDRDSLNHGFSSFVSCAVLECLAHLR